MQHGHLAEMQAVGCDARCCCCGQRLLRVADAGSHPTPLCSRFNAPAHLVPTLLASHLCCQVMEGANVEVDEAAEERKGGAGDLAKVGAMLTCASRLSGTAWALRGSMYTCIGRQLLCPAPGQSDAQLVPVAGPLGARHMLVQLYHCMARL